MNVMEQKNKINREEKKAANDNSMTNYVEEKMYFNGLIVYSTVGWKVRLLFVTTKSPLIMKGPNYTVRFCFFIIIMLLNEFQKTTEHFCLIISGLLS